MLILLRQCNTSIQIGNRVPSNKVPYGYRLCLDAVVHEIQGRPYVPLFNGVAACNKNE